MNYKEKGEFPQKQCDGCAFFDDLEEGKESRCSLIEWAVSLECKFSLDQILASYRARIMKYKYTPEEREQIRQRMEDAIMDRPGPPEITVTFHNSCVETVDHIHRGQSVITREVDDEATGDPDFMPLIVRRWYFNGSSEIVYEGEIEKEKIPKVDNYDTI